MGCSSLFYNCSCLVIRFLIIVAYLCVGAAVFRTLEKDSGVERWSEKQEIEQYFDWFHFAFSSTTTIGYGDVVPATSNGKLFYIFYCIVGIPLMIWYLAMCGQVQNDIYTNVLKSLRTCLWHKNDKSYKDVGPVLISALVLFIFWFLGSVILHKTTDLSLLDCVYYWFSTLTTSGFGDVLIRGKVAASTFYCWLMYKWFLLNLTFGLIQSTLVWISGFHEAKQSMCCICWHSDNYDHADQDTIARYNLELAKQQDFIQFHRQTQY